MIHKPVPERWGSVAAVFGQCCLRYRTIIFTRNTYVINIIALNSKTSPTKIGYIDSIGHLTFVVVASGFHIQGAIQIPFLSTEVASISRQYVRVLPALSLCNQALLPIPSSRQIHLEQ